MVYLLTLFVLLQAGDALTTYKILTNGGKELNKPLAWVFEQIGLVPGLLIYKGTCSALGGYLYMQGETVVLSALTVLYVIVVAHNVEQMKK